MGVEVRIEFDVEEELIGSVNETLMVLQKVNIVLEDWFCALDLHSYENIKTKKLP